MDKFDPITELVLLREKAESMPFAKGQTGLIRKINHFISHLESHAGDGMGTDLFVRDCQNTYDAIFGAEK